MNFSTLKIAFHHPSRVLQTTATKMSAFIFGSPLTLSFRSPTRTICSQTQSTFINKPNIENTKTPNQSNVQRRHLSMVLDRPRRVRGGNIWGPSSFSDFMWPERMMSRFLEPFSDMVPFMGDDGLIEENDQYKIQMMLPGISKEDIKVDVKNDILTVRVESKEEEERKTDEGKGHVEWIRKQMRRIHRSWRMPENADLNNVKAVTKDGIFTLTIPKTDKSEPGRVIDVQGE